MVSSLLAVPLTLACPKPAVHILNFGRLPMLAHTVCDVHSTDFGPLTEAKPLGSRFVFQIGYDLEGCDQLVVLFTEGAGL